MPTRKQTNDLGTPENPVGAQRTADDGLLYVVHPLDAREPSNVSGHTMLAS